jgi:hypothetical protein
MRGNKGFTRVTYFDLRGAIKIDVFSWEVAAVELGVTQKLEYNGVYAGVFCVGLF